VRSITWKAQCGPMVVQCPCTQRRHSGAHWTLESPASGPDLGKSQGDVQSFASRSKIATI